MVAHQASDSTLDLKLFQYVKHNLRLVFSSMLTENRRKAKRVFIRCPDGLIRSRYTLRMAIAI